MSGLLEINASLYRVQPGYFEKLVIPDTRILNVSQEELAYVKLINLNVYKGSNNTPVVKDAEIEVYKKPY